MQQVIQKNNLTVNQKQAIEMLSIGKSITETSCELNIGRSTIYSWFDNKNFKSELNKALDKKLTWLTFQGLTEIEDILLHSLNPNHKLKAFEIIAKLSEHFKDEPITNTKPSNLANITLEEILEEANNF